MTQTIHRKVSRGRPEGRAHRARLRILVLPTLHLGQPVPTARTLGWLLRINQSEAWRHMRRALAEAGIATETRGMGRGKRVYVVSIPSQEIAA